MAKDGFRAMFRAGGAPPMGRFSDLSMLEPVKDYPQRHASTLLEATAEARRLARAWAASARTSPADAA